MPFRFPRLSGRTNDPPFVDGPNAGGRAARPRGNAGDEALIAGEDIICVSSIDWDFNWQGHQEIMSALAAAGNRVLFVENTGVRAPRLRDLPRLRRRIGNWWRSTRGFHQERERLYVYSPLILPFPFSRPARFVNRLLLVRSLRRWMEAARFQRPILWTFLPTALVVDLVDALDPELVVYYCIADFDQLAANPRQIARSERMLLDRCHVVFVQGEALRARCEPHENIHTFPFGVKLETFERELERAPELAGLPRPIVGYVGGIHRHVDMELVRHVAERIDGTIVLVGPRQTDVSRLEGLKNVVFVDQQPHARIPEFISAFDVGIIPYLLSDYTRTVYPTKLNEYLALGLPVVSTDLPEVRRFANENGPVVAVASTREAFVDEVRQAAGKRSPMDVQRRVTAARRNSWDARILEMSRVMASALAVRDVAGTRWEQRLKRLYRVARRRAALSIATILAVYLLLFQTNLVWLTARPLRVTAPPQPADAVVVFGGGMGESGLAGGGYQERVQQALDLYHAGHASHLLFASGYLSAFPEADVMRDLAIDEGVSPDAVVVDTDATNTYDGVVSAHAIAKTNGWRRVLLVSSPYHMRRAVLTWHTQAPEITVIPTPPPYSAFFDHNRGASFEQIRAIVHEYAAIVAYWWRGWI